jgi:hypothetical protein
LALLLLEHPDMQPLRGASYETIGKECAETIPKS